MNGKRMVVPQVSWVYPERRQWKKGDVILSIDGKEVQGRGDLNAYLSTLNPRTNVSVEIWRNGDIQQLELMTEDLPESVVDMALQDILGIHLVDKQSSLVVVRMQSGGAFSKNGLKVGDQILALNGQRVSSMDEVRTILGNAKSDHKGSAIFTIRRGRYQGQIELPI